MTSCEPKKKASSCQQAPDNAPSQKATSEPVLASMNLGVPSNAMMRSSTLPTQAGRPGGAQADKPGNAQPNGSGDAQNGEPGDAQNGEPGVAQTNTSSIQRSQHDSRGSEGHHTGARRRYHQEPSYESSSDDEDLQDVYVAVMGVTGAGKSTFIEKLTGKEVNIGHGLFSCTVDVEEYTFVYKDRYKVHLIDTPGFDDTQRKDIDVLKEISGWLSVAFVSHIKLSGIIYLHRITDPRMSGTARKNLFMFKKLCGPDCFHKVCLVTTMWENVDEGTGSMREKELIDTEDFWGYMAQNGSQVRRHMNTRGSAVSIFRALIKDKLDIVLDIQKELGDNVRLDDTGAGRALNEEIHELQEKYKRDIADLEKEKQEALRRGYAESVEQIEEIQRENAQKLEQMAQDRQNTEVYMVRLLEEREQQLREIEERSARTDQELREKQEQLKVMKLQGEASPEQTQALEQEINTIEQTSKIEHEKIEKKRGWVTRTVEWVSKHRKGLSEVVMVGTKVVGAIKAAQ